jgi:hypothetical protein
MPKVLVYVTAFMSLFYIAAGAFIILNPNSSKIVSPPYNLFLGAAVVAYGLFRGYRSLAHLKNLK